MVGVGKGLGADAPGRIPFEGLEVHENAHQLWDGQCRVSVIQLNSDLVWRGGEGGGRRRQRGRRGEAMGRGGGGRRRRRGKRWGMMKKPV